MKYFFRILIFSLLISFWLSIFPVNAQQNFENGPVWLSASGQKSSDLSNQQQVKTFSENTLDVLITFPGVWAELQNEKGEDFTRLWQDEYGSYREPGQPALPGKTFNILIPRGAQVEVLNQDISSKTFYLSDYSFPATITPAQIQVSKSEPPPPWTQPDPQYYGSPNTFPQNWVELQTTFQMRDYTILPIWINPVRYSPGKGEIEILEQIELRLTWQTSSLDGARNTVVSDSPSFDRLVSQIVINPPELPAYTTKAETGEGYLIITPDVFEGSIELQNFIQMKKDQGFSVTVTNLSLIGNTANQIRSYVKQAYINFDPRPAYLLLIGDTNFIPGFNRDNFEGLDDYFDKTTDLYYGTMDDDYYPEIAVGRLPVRSIDDLSQLINKISSYNNLEYQDWQIQASFIASCDNFSISEGSHNYVIENFTAPLNYPTFFPSFDLSPGGDKLYCATYTAREINILESLNNGRGLITYSGHGNVISWTELNALLYNITSSDLELLIENNAYSFVSSFACLTNDFGNSTIPSVFGETWMLLENKGAIAFLGSADETLWGPDDAFERKLFEILYFDPLNPPSLQTAITGALSEISFPTKGIGTEQYYRETYNLLGDPSQKLWLYPDADYFFLAQTSDYDRSGLIGSIVDYPINLTNYGETDIYTVEINNNKWTTEVNEINEVLSKTRIPLTTSVQIPQTALPGEFDQVDVTIISSNSGQSITITFTTTSLMTYFTRLPLIFK